MQLTKGKYRSRGRGRGCGCCGQTRGHWRCRGRRRGCGRIVVRFRCRGLCRGSNCDRGPAGKGENGGRNKFSSYSGNTAGSVAVAFVVGANAVVFRVVVIDVVVCWVVVVVAVVVSVGVIGVVVGWVVVAVVVKVAVSVVVMKQQKENTVTATGSGHIKIMSFSWANSWTKSWSRSWPGSLSRSWSSRAQWSLSRA